MRTGGPTPLPLKACPWCGAALEAGCFTVYPHLSKPQRLDVTCSNAGCAFSEDRLPIATVDDEIYRRLPAFLIATVDKFANVPWEGRLGAFFGHVARHDASGVKRLGNGTLDRRPKGTPCGGGLSTLAWVAVEP
jgi:hypothetical protein